MEIKEILKTRKYKAGYELRTELWHDGTEEWTMQSAYTPTGDYIGRSKEANFLINKRGIKPEKITPTSSVCSIGFCEEEQKWYGWSHRAICGFTIGSTVKVGDCAFKPSNKEEYLESLKSWYSDELYPNSRIEVTEDGYQVVFDTDDPSAISGCFHPFADVEFGRGEWVAKTLEDAKQMAIDFAEDIS